MSLFCLFISQPAFPLRLCLSFISLCICLCISHSPSTTSHVTDLHFSRSVSLYVQFFFLPPIKQRALFERRLLIFFFNFHKFFLFSFNFILAPSTDTFLLFLPLHTSWDNAVPASWCNIMQTVRNPLENSPLPSKTAPKCNLAGVTEVRLRRRCKCCSCFPTLSRAHLRESEYNTTAQFTSHSDSAAESLCDFSKIWPVMTS